MKHYIVGNQIREVSKHSFIIVTPILMLIFSHFTSFGQNTLYFTDPIQNAYKEICKLKIDNGKAILEKQKASDPNNAMVYYIENYADFFTLFIQEDYLQYKRLLKNKDYRLQKIKDSNPDSPYYLFCQAEVILQWATIKLKFDDKINAARDVFEAYKLLEKNKLKYPEFKENNKSLSIIHALAESVPSWVRTIMGIKGSVALGTNEIKKLAEDPNLQKSMYKDEIIAIYSYILFYANNQKMQAYELFEKYNLHYKSNLLICFLQASMAHKLGLNDQALYILESRPIGNEYLPFYYLDFMKGKFKLCKLEGDANIYIENFIQNFKGKHYIKEAYQKLAWYYLIIKKDNALYRLNMQKAINNGNNLLDEDVQAHKEAKAKQIPNPILLQARLLYDGGYYSKCQVLLIKNQSQYNNSKYTGEYYYRLARVSEALLNYFEAIEYYQKCIKSSDTKQYYPCSANLQMGLIYEKIKQPNLAIKHFEYCLDLEPNEYKESLHQKAKTALNRVKN